MKQILLLIIVFLTASLSAAPIKVALLGEKDQVDLLTVKLSQHEDVQLLERGEIERIVREHNLTAVSGAELCKYFPHADVIGIVSPVSVSFFNAKNTLKLGRVPIDNVDLKILRKSTARDSFPLSIGFVTLTDIPERMRPAVGRMVLELEKTLLNTDKVQMLEREHLSAILQEREVSDNLFTPVSSLNIIRCDFTQGKNADMINLTLSLRDTAGRILFEKQYVGLESGTLPASDIARLLKSTALKAQSESREQEAALYLKEYYAAIRRQGYRPVNLPQDNFNSLRKYVDAMFVLAPENPRYQYEKLFYDLCSVTSPGMPWNDKIAVLQKFVNGAKRLRREHPDFRFPYGNGSCGFSFHPAFPTQPLMNLYQNHYPPTEDEAKILSTLNDEIHTMHMEIHLQFSEYAQNDPAEIKTWRDLYNYQETIRLGMDLLPHFDAEKTVQIAWQAELEELSATVEFIRKNPKETKRSARNQFYFPATNELRGIYRKKEAWARVREILNSELVKLETLPQCVKSQPFRYHLMELRAIRDFLNSTGTMEDFKRCYTAMMTEFVQKENFRPRPRSIIGVHILGAATEYFGLNPQEVVELMFTIPNAVASRQKNLTDKERGLLAISAMDRSVPVKYIQNLAFPGICDNAIGNSIQSFADSLHHNLAVNQNWLNDLNNAFEIRTIPLPAQDSRLKEIKFCCNAVMHQDRFYLLYEDESGQWRFFEFSPEENQLRELAGIDVKTREFMPEMRGRGQSGFPAMAGFESKIFIGGHKTIAVYDLNSDSWQIHHDLPGEHITGIHYDGQHIYYLCGGDFSKHISMHRCNLDGSERKSYFNGKNGNPPCGGSPTGFSCGFFPTVDGKLLFTMAGKSNDGLLLTFSLEEETFELVSKHSGAKHEFSLRRNGDFLLGNDGPYFGCSFFKFDPSKNNAKPEPFFTQYSGDKRKFRYRINGYHSIRHPAVLVEDRYLVSADQFGNWVLDLRNPEKSPLLLLPRCISVFYLSKQKLFLFPGFFTPNCNLYLVKLRMMDK